MNDAVTVYPNPSTKKSMEQNQVRLKATTPTGDISPGRREYGKNLPARSEMARKPRTDGTRILHEKAYVLETGQKLDFTPYPETAITVRLPYEPIDVNITVIVLEFDNNLAKLIP